MRIIGLVIVVTFITIALGLIIYKTVVWNDARNLMNSIEEFRIKERRIQRITSGMMKEDRLGLPVLYINMDSSADRQHFMENQLEEFGINGTRISAVNGANIADVRKGKENGISFTNNYKTSKGELGCTLSHLKAIQHAYDSGYEISIILEDDACMTLMPLWDVDIPILISQVNDWDILQLATSRPHRTSNSVRDFDNWWGTFAYVINRNGMQNIIDAVYRDGTFHLDKNHLSQPSGKTHGRADMFLYVTAGRTKTIMTPLIYNADIKSQIHTQYDKHVYKLGIQYFDHYLNNTLSSLGECYVPMNDKPVIWSVWTGTNSIHPYLQLCHETVVRHNERDFTVILVTPDNLSEFLTGLHPAYELLSYVHRADYLRHALLHKYGGIYLDMDTICFKSLYPLLKLLKYANVVGYDGSRWGEIWGMGSMAPLRPNSEYTSEWGTRLHEELDNQLAVLQEYRRTSPSLEKDCLIWASILRDIVLPLSHEIKEYIGYAIIDEDWQSISEIEIVKRGEAPEISDSILNLNNSLYSSEIKTASKEQVMESNIILFKILSRSLISHLPSPRILPGVDAILYINLEHREDRKTRLFSELLELGISSNKLVRVHAVYEPTNGAVGCLQSHINALEMAIEQFPNQKVLIIEDDIISRENSDPIHLLKKFFANPEFNVHWDVLMLAHNTRMKEETSDANIIRLRDSQTAAAYLVNGSYAKVILETLRSSYNTYLATGKWLEEYYNDQCWKYLQKEDYWYGIDPSPFIQGDSYSDIIQEHVSYKV
jgi:GR25 family glycosyltransferase involved in LPS biosynthesis